MNVTSFFAGDTLRFEVTLDAYPANAGNTLKYRLARIGGGTPIDLTASAAADKHLVEVLAATTSGWVAGEYSWTSWIDNGSDKYTIDQGLVTIKADPRTATTGTDSRSYARRMLAALEAALLQHAQTGTLAASYQINGRSMTFRSAKELRDERDYWAAQVAGEDAGAGITQGRKPFGNKLLVRLG